MTNSKSQLTKDLQTAFTKLGSLKKLTIKSWLVVSLFVFLTVSLVAALYLSQQSAEDRSGATGGVEYYFSPAAAVLTQNTQGVLQPVENIQIRSSAGRPVVSYSFVMRITDAQGQPVPDSVWSQVQFAPNPKFATHNSALLGSSVPGAKLFAGTIGQQKNGVTSIYNAVTDGLLGVFIFSPTAEQQDLRMSFYAVPGKPQANSLYVLGSIMTPPSTNGEIQISQADFNNSFTLHNPFLVEPTQPPVGHDVDAGWFWYKTSNTDSGRDVADKFDGYNVGGTLQTFTDLDHIDSVWRNSSLAPAFRIRVRKPDGTFRTTVVDGATTDVLVESNPRGSFAEGQFWANWKVTGTATALLLTLPNTNYSLPIFRGDTVEATINLKRIDNGIVYNCTVNNRLVVYPVGQPGQQQELGACANFSKALLEFATPVPTDTPAPPPADPTYRVTVNYSIHPGFTSYFNNYCSSSGASTISGVAFSLTGIPADCVVNATPKLLSCAEFAPTVATGNGHTGSIYFDVLRSCSDLTGAVSAAVQSCDTPGRNYTNTRRSVVINQNLTLNMYIGADSSTSGLCSGPTVTPTPTAIP